MFGIWAVERVWKEGAIVAEVLIATVEDANIGLLMTIWAFFVSAVPILCMVVRTADVLLYEVNTHLESDFRFDVYWSFLVEVEGSMQDMKKEGLRGRR